MAVIQNPRRKGTANRTKAKLKLESDGWLVAQVELTGRFRKIRDMYGLWDLCAVLPNRTKLVQVKSNTKPNLDMFKEFALKYPQFECEVWIHHDHRREEPWEILRM